MKKNQKKKCSKCKDEKLLSFFYNNRRHLFGKAPYCKECHKKEQKARTTKYKERYKAISRAYYWKNRERELLKGKKRYIKNKDKIQVRHKKWREDNKEYMADYHKKWYAKNRKDKLAKNYKWERNQSKSNPIFKIRKNLRIRVYNVIKNNVKSASIMKLLGCSIEFLKSYIEKRFVPGMTWENYGPCWHIDHKKPCALFDFSKEDDQKKCFHYTNLQPLFAIDNMRKHAKY